MTTWARAGVSQVGRAGAGVPRRLRQEQVWRRDQLGRPAGATMRRPACSARAVCPWARHGRRMRPVSSCSALCAGRPDVGLATRSTNGLATVSSVPEGQWGPSGSTRRRAPVARCALERSLPRPVYGV